MIFKTDNVNSEVVKISILDTDSGVEVKATDSSGVTSTIFKFCNDGTFRRFLCVKIKGIK